VPAFGLDTAPELFKNNYGDKKTTDSQVSNKIRKMVREKKKGRSHKQIVAIAISMSKDHKK